MRKYDIDELIDEIYPIDCIFAERKHDFMAYPDTECQLIPRQDGLVGSEETECWLNTRKGKIYVEKI